jgi:hypothetical protein
MNKAPLPFQQIEKNRQFVTLFSSLDDYSKSIFLNRITSEEKPAKIILPLLIKEFKDFNDKQFEQIEDSYRKFEILRNGI